VEIFVLATLFEFGEFPVLETERLILRQLTPEDGESVFDIRKNFEVTRYNGGAAYTDIEQAFRLIDRVSGDYMHGLSLRWGITLRGNDRVIGMCGYNYWIRIDARASIGYDLAYEHWGRGIMPEAVGAMIDFGFDHMLLNRIEADASLENTASARVLEKLGFTCEGIQREQYFEEEDYHDLVLFALLRADYEERRR
jgi:[ribosomal protein S5]-alanine N-acetyltransferase